MAVGRFVITFDTEEKFKQAQNELAKAAEALRAAGNDLEVAFPFLNSVIEYLNRNQNFGVDKNEVEK